MTFPFRGCLRGLFMLYRARACGSQASPLPYTCSRRPRGYQHIPIRCAMRTPRRLLLLFWAGSYLAGSLADERPSPLPPSDDQHVDDLFKNNDVTAATAADNASKYAGSATAAHDASVATRSGAELQQGEEDRTEGHTAKTLDHGRRDGGRGRMVGKTETTSGDDSGDVVESTAAAAVAAAAGAADAAADAADAAADAIGVAAAAAEAVSDAADAVASAAAAAGDVEYDDERQDAGRNTTRGRGRSVNDRFTAPAAGAAMRQGMRSSPDSDSGSTVEGWRDNVGVHADSSQAGGDGFFHRGRGKDDGMGKGKDKPTRNALQSYDALLEEHYLKMSFLQATALGLVGDTIAQRLERRWNPGQRFEFKRMAYAGVLNMIIDGLFTPRWYNLVDRINDEMTLRVAFIKALAASVLYGPFANGLFLAGACALRYGMEARFDWAEWRRQLAVCTVRDFEMWPPLHILSFWLVPKHWRPLTAHLVGVALLAVVSSTGLTDALPWGQRAAPVAMRWARGVLDVVRRRVGRRLRRVSGAPREAGT